MVREWQEQTKSEVFVDRRHARYGCGLGGVRKSAGAIRLKPDFDESSSIASSSPGAQNRTVSASAKLWPRLSLCAEHERQLGGGSPLSSLMAAKD